MFGSEFWIIFQLSLGNLAQLMKKMPYFRKQITKVSITDVSESEWCVIIRFLAGNDLLLWPIIVA